MDVQVSWEEGHALVAAVRVLQYRLKRTPTLAEVAEILGSTVEITNHRLRALGNLGIVTFIENPFEVHVSVRDYLALEKLPAQVSEAGLSEAVEDFKKRQAEKTEERMRLFEEGSVAKERQERQERHEGDLKSFKPKKNTNKAPWEK